MPLFELECVWGLKPHLFFGDFPGPATIFAGLANSQGYAQMPHCWIKRCGVLDPFAMAGAALLLACSGFPQPRGAAPRHRLRPLPRPLRLHSLPPRPGV